MYKETSKGTSVSTVYKFVDVDGRIVKLLERGENIRNVVKQFKDLLVGISRVEGNVFLYEGVNFIWRAVTGESGLTYFKSNSCIGVGDGTDDPSPSQSGLTGTNKTYKQVDAGYPQITDNKIMFRASFGPDEGNHAWQEWTVANGCGDEYININRRKDNLGVKSSGSTWVLEVTLTII
jgi:hypothetical protein